ncbi:MAG: cysteinyl-tRNA synthetase [Paracoccaceae bacterium]|jgi:cysteinyl-tRNA synthetase
MTNHPIRLRNSLTSEKQTFIPLDWQAGPDANGADAPGAMVRMYVCGPTVYDRAHIGNARPAVVFDTLYRLLRLVYGASRVRYVRNITDVDDKILARAVDRAVPIETITEETSAWYMEDMAAVGALAPDLQPRATQYIDQMQGMIARLIASGNAYEAEGHVLFAVDSYEGYGKLSGRSTDDMIAGARVEVAPYKRNPMDFVLWKPSAPDQQGWDSVWGRGRPGWHIECSAMAEETLGADFDIHGGGADLMFPHHENEIAQSCCAVPGSSFAQVWLHNGMIKIDGKKMSKSLGNFTTVHDLRETMNGAAIRLAFLMTHYRAELDWSEQRRAEAEAKLARWRDALGRCWTVAKAGKSVGLRSKPVFDALCDDLNTSLAVAAIDQLAARAYKRDAAAAAEMIWALDLIGVDLDADGAMTALIAAHEAEEEGRRVSATKDFAGADLIDTLLAARTQAKFARDFARADAIRDGLTAAGVTVMDTASGPTWTVAADFDAAKLEGLK